MLSGYPRRHLGNYIGLILVYLLSNNVPRLLSNAAHAHKSSIDGVSESTGGGPSMLLEWPHQEWTSGGLKQRSTP